MTVNVMMEKGFSWRTAADVEAFKTAVAEGLDEYQWGTFGPEADQPMTVRLLKDLDTEHLENILITQNQIGVEYRAAIILLLRERYTR